MSSRRRRIEDVTLNDRVVPHLHTNKPTTYGELRAMAYDVARRTAQNSVERGLALSILAIIDDYEEQIQP